MRLMLIGVLMAGCAALAGCVVVPGRAYLAVPRVAVVAPAPYIAVHPYYHYYGP